MDYTPFRVKIKHISIAKKKPGLTPLRGKPVGIIGYPGMDILSAAEIIDNVFRLLQEAPHEGHIACRGRSIRHKAEHRKYYFIAVVAFEFFL